MDGVSDHEPRKGKPVSIWIVMLQMSLRKRGNQLGSTSVKLSMIVWGVILFSDMSKTYTELVEEIDHLYEKGMSQSEGAEETR